MSLLGDLSSQLQPLFKALVVERRGEPVITDGYVDEAASRPTFNIRGVIVPEKSLSGGLQGTIPSGGMRLYTTDLQSEIRLNDIIIDGTSRWKVIEKMDYTQFGHILIFKVVSDRAK